MGRKPAPVPNMTVPSGDYRTRQHPLFANESQVDGDLIQTPSDRFQRWLVNFHSLITEYRTAELIIWDTDLAEIFDHPSEEALRRHMSKANEWTELLHMLSLIQMAFSRMLLRDQLQAAELFEVQDVTNMVANKARVMVPSVVEILRVSFQSPFLASSFDTIWAIIKARKIEPIAIYELKRVTVHKIPGQWIREDRNGDRIFAVTHLLQNRRARCDVCGEPAAVPYPACWFCKINPCYHHGRCCPYRPEQASSSSSRRLPNRSTPGRPILAQGF